MNKKGFISIQFLAGFLLIGLIVTLGAITLFKNQKITTSKSRVSEVKRNIQVQEKSVLGSQNPVELEIIVAKNGFIPSTLLINKGQQVKWTNKDTSSHQITSDNLKTLSETDPLKPNQSFTYTFESPGEYTFTDINNSLKGKIIVQ